MFNGCVADHWAISLLIVQTELLFHHITEVYHSPVLLVHEGEAQHTVRCGNRQQVGVWSHMSGSECVLGNGKKSRKHQRILQGKLRLFFSFCLQGHPSFTIYFKITLLLLLNSEQRCVILS